MDPIDPNADYIMSGQALMALVANFGAAAPEMRHGAVVNIQAALNSIRPMLEPDADWKAKYEAELSARNSEIMKRMTDSMKTDATPVEFAAG